MSVLDGPGEGTWSVFAQKVVEERDALREKVASLEAELACAKAFHDVAVKERDFYKTRLAHAEADAEQAIAYLEQDLVAFRERAARVAVRHGNLTTAEAIRAMKCCCQIEAGDSPCPMHGAGRLWMREALRAAEKRELEALAELNEREADVETLQTHVEVQREALQKTSKAVAKLVVPITKIEELLTENGCDCECEHCWQDHDEDCERCLACRINMAILKEDE